MLHQKLVKRPAQELLLDQNILRANPQGIAPSLAAIQETLRRQKLEDKVDHQLESRRDYDQLRSQNILRDDADQLEKEKIRSQTLTELDRKIEDRPRINDLVDHNILIDASAAPNLQATMQVLKRQQLNQKLDVKLELRPSAGFLVNQNIMKDEAIAPSLQNAASSLDRKLTEHVLEHKLENRKGETILLDTHVLHSSHNTKLSPKVQRSHEHLQKRQVFTL